MLLSQDIKYLKGVGPMRAKALEKDLGIHTIEDLVTTYPYRYIDRSKIYAIRELREGMQYVQIKGKILYFETEGEGRKKRLKATLPMVSELWSLSGSAVWLMYANGTRSARNI